MPKPFSRRAFLASLGLGGAALAGYSHGVEAEWLEIGRHDVKTNVSGASPVRLLHLSDLHASSSVSLSYIQESLRRGLELQPDLVCVTGDFITATYDHFENYARVLARLRKAAPVYACLGNHDGGLWSRYNGGYLDTQKVRRLLRASGIELLHNRSTTLSARDRKLEIVGLGDCHALEADPEKAFQNCAVGQTTRVVLSHNPDTKVMLEPYAWDLLLCGHTHGGQVWLPILGAPWAPVEDKRFIAGLYRWQDRWIHITKGVGNVHGFRINCRPEVSLLTLV